MLLGEGMSQELKARAESYTVSRATTAFASFLPCPPILSWHVVLVPCPGQALPDCLPGPQFPPCRQPNIVEPVWVLGTEKRGLESRPHTDYWGHLRQAPDASQALVSRSVNKGL